MRSKIYIIIISVLVLFFSSLNTVIAQQIQPSAVRQIQSLIDEKEARTTAQKKMDSQLWYAIKMGRGEAITNEVETLKVELRKDINGLVLIDINGRIDNILLEAIIKAGGNIIFSSPTFKVVSAAVPLQKLEEIASLDQVKSIYPAYPAQHAGFSNSNNKSSVSNGVVGISPYRLNTKTKIEKYHSNFKERADQIRKQVTKFLTNNKFYSKPFIGAATSQGDVKHKADLARTTFSVNGNGIKIGILSDSYNSFGAAASNVTAGDLPGVGNPNGFTTPVTILSDINNGSDEGRAMLQIVHDLAPGAQLYFASAFNGQADFAQKILDLQAAGCDIICDDVNYLDEPVFQDGIIAQAVNTVTASGAIYFSSAGNAGNKNDGTSGVWEGDFFDAGTAVVGTVTLTGGTVHDFGGLTNNQLTAIGNGVEIFWSDPQGGSTNDYDLFVLNAGLTAVVSSGTTVQNGTQNPIELITPSPAAGTRIVILRKTGAASRALHLNTIRGRLSVNTSGQTHGHGSSAAAFAVAATQASGAGPFTASAVVENFSSDGLRRKFYNPNGTAVTPGNFLFATNGGIVLQKPDITAADGVSTTLPPGGLNPFFGTSAAAPHAAAITALLKQRNPLLTPAQIRTALTTTAIDIETPGTDRDAGFGIVMALEALQSVVAAPGLISTGSTLVTESCAPNNGVVDPGESVTVSFCIKNFGGTATTNLVGTLLSTGGVTSPSAPQNYGAVPAGGAPVCRNFTFSNSGTCGGTITASIQFQDGATNLGTFTYIFTLGVPTIKLAQNFDAVSTPALPASWTTDFSGSGTAWTSSATNPASAPNAAFGQEQLTTAVTNLNSPAIPITTTAARLSFSNLFNLETGFDGELLEIKIGAGAFQDIITAGGSFVSGGYNGILDASTAFPGRNAWTGLSGGTTTTPAYATTVVNLPASAAGQNIQLRWRVSSDEGTAGANSPGVRIDNIVITDGTNCCTPAVIAPAVTINQATGQLDPTAVSPINFTVVFSEAVTGFGPTDINFAGSTVSGTLTAVITGAGPTYNVAVSGMTGTGIVVASIPANAAINAGSTGNTASTSLDNSVGFGTPPTVTINQGATQADPAVTPPIVFDVVFSQSVTGFTAADINYTGTTAPGTLSAVITGTGPAYIVSVSGMTGGGLVIASIPANAVLNSVGFGNTASTSTDNQVNFNFTPPTCALTCPADITVNTTANQCGAIVTFPPPTAVGICGTITYSPASGSFFPKGVTTVTATSTTGATCTFKVTVVDNQAPTITCTANLTVSCASAVPAVSIASVTASDNCPGVSVTHVGDVISAQTCINRFIVTRTYRATDAAGLVTNCSQTITVNDVTVPVIAPIANITTTTSIGTCTAIVSFTPTATDNCTGTVTITSAPAAGSAFPIGTTLVTVTATDVCGNQATRTFNVIVTDAQVPVVGTSPGNRTVCVGTNAVFSVTATNAVSYQWQQFIGGVWTNVAGATSSTLTLNTVTQSMNTNTYRVNIAGLCSSTTSTFASLYVNRLPTVSLTASNAPVLLPTQTTDITANVSPAGGTFAWFINGSPLVPAVTTGTLTNLAVENVGSYRTVYIDLNGCINTSGDLIVSAEPSTRLYIAPNPNFGQFWVRYYNQVNEQLVLRVFDVKGAVVYQKKVTTTVAYSRIDIDLGNNAPGVYVVELRNTTGKLLANKRMIVGPR